MNTTVEAKVDEAGVIRPKEPIALLITVLSIPATSVFDPGVVVHYR